MFLIAIGAGVRALKKQISILLQSELLWRKSWSEIGQATKTNYNM